MVRSQTASLTPDPSFAHNLGYRCPNDQCEGILDIYTSRPFQRHQEHPNARCFDLCCRTLNIRESRRTPNPQLWECWASPPHLAKVGLRHSHISTRKFVSFQQECLSHLNDQNLTMTSLKYVGWIKEILELDYGQFQTIVLLYNWVVANYEGLNANIKGDGYGFTLMNFKHFIPMST